MPCLQCSEAKSIPTEPVSPSEAAGCSGIGEEVPAAGFKAWTAKAPKTKSLLSAWGKKKKKKARKPPGSFQGTPRPRQPPPASAPPGSSLWGTGCKAAWSFVPLLSAFNLLKRTSYSSHLLLVFPPYSLRGLVFCWFGGVFFKGKKSVSG